MVRAVICSGSYLLAVHPVIGSAARIFPFLKKLLKSASALMGYPDAFYQLPWNRGYVHVEKYAFRHPALKHFAANFSAEFRGVGKVRIGERCERYRDRRYAQYDTFRGGGYSSRIYHIGADIGPAIYA